MSFSTICGTIMMNGSHGKRGACTAQSLSCQSLCQNKSQMLPRALVLRRSFSRYADNAVSFAVLMPLFTVMLCWFATVGRVQAQSSISGSVTGTTATVLMTLTGTVNGNLFTTGLYEFMGLPNGMYTVTPSLAGFTFVPASRTITLTGTNSVNNDFVAITQASITLTSFMPTVGTTGSNITLTGSGFTTATAVSFGGVAAQSFTIVSDTQITAVVSAGGASGVVQVLSPLGGAGLAGFTFTTGTVSGNFSAPTLSTIANQSITVNSSTGFLAFTVSDDQTPASALTVFGSASNPTLLPSSGIVFGGSGANRTVRLTPAPGQSGTTLVTIGVSDGEFSSSISFFLTVTGIGVPVITSFTPSAQQGGQVMIRGTGLTGTIGVSFGGTPAASFVTTGDTLITAVVGTGSSGAVNVITPIGAASANGFTFLPATPLVAGFVPNRATSGTVVTIFGQNFINVTNVSFGNVPATSFSVISPTQLTAIVSTGASGNVAVTNTGGTGQASGFMFLAPPRVVGFSPLSAAAGATVSIFGFGFSDATGVTFGGARAASFQIVSDTQINAVVGAGASGEVRVHTNLGSAALAGFTFLGGGSGAGIIISGFSPTSATTDSAVTIFGVGFTGATAVSFGGTMARSIQILSDTQIRAIVGTGSSGAVTVTSPLGTASAAGFTFIPPAAANPPRISPVPNQTVRMNTNTGQIPVTVSGGRVPSEALNIFASSNNQLLLPNANIVQEGIGANRFITLFPAQNQTGTALITLVVSDGTQTASTQFTLTVTRPPQPAVLGFNPPAAGAGEAVIIAGRGFTAASAVSFGGVPALNFTVNSDTQISAVVANGSSGAVTVIAPGGVAMLQGFTFLTPPSITDFTPKIVVTSGTVTILGRGFTGATSVAFGGIPALFRQTTDDRITATVTSGSSGAVSVTTPRGFASQQGFVFIPEGRNIPPEISLIPNQILGVNQSTGAIPFFVSDANQPAENLQVFASSSNQALIPNNAMQLGGTGTLRTITITPNRNQTGTSLISLVVFNGVLQSSTSFLVRVDMQTSIHAQERGTDRLAPNPLRDVLTLTATIDEPTSVRVEVISMLGRTMLSWSEWAAPGALTKTFDLSSLPTGMYVVSVHKGTRRWTEKLLKQ